MKDIRLTIVDNVKIFRKRNNLTQMDLAEKADISIDTIKRIENARTGISLENTIRITNVLDIPLSYLAYENSSDIKDKDIEEMIYIMNGRTDKEKAYLLHMLKQMIIGMDRIISKIDI